MKNEIDVSVPFFGLIEELVRAFKLDDISKHVTEFTLKVKAMEYPLLTVVYEIHNKGEVDFKSLEFDLHPHVEGSAAQRPVSNPEQ